MKKKSTLFILASILFLKLGWSQPIVSDAIQSAIGTKTFGYVIPGPITHGTTGANQTWDYSAIVHDTSTYYFEHIDFASLPAPEQAAFPTGNVASSYVVGGTEVARLAFQLDATQFLYLGLNGSAFPVPVTFFTFPQNYTETNSAGLTYDAYGTLTTPFGTWNNVVRLKATSGGDYKYDYYQFAPTYVLLMEYLVDTNTLAVSGQTFYNSPSLTGVNEELSASNQISIYPNPSTGEFFIDQHGFYNGTNLEVFNSVGEKVLQQQTVNEIDLSTYPSGIYYVIINDGEKRVTKKIMVE